MHSTTKQWHCEILDPQQLDREELLSFLREEYGTRDAAQSDYFEWCCLKNPAGQALVPTIRDPDNGRIVGQYWLVPLRARIEGGVRRCLLGANFSVHRDYRRQGVIRSMQPHTAVALRERGFEFTIGFPNPNMAKAVETYKDTVLIGRLGMYVRPQDWSFLEQTPLKRMPLRSAAQAIASTVWPWVFRPRPVDHSTSSLTVSQTSDYGSLFDDFWLRVQNKYPAILVRDSDFLRWRYQLHPRRRYLTFVAEDSGELVAYIIIRSTRVLGLRVGAIVDFLVEPSQRGEQAGNLLISEVTSFFQAQQRQLVACILTPPTQEKSILRRQGFVAVPRSLQPQQVIVSLRTYVDTVPLSTISDIRNWFFMLGDYDII